MQVLAFQQNNASLSAATLRQENITYLDTGGISQNNRSQGFVPAFLETLSGTIYLSRFANGRIAPMHLLDGLPPELIVCGNGSKTGRQIKDTLISGFVLDGCFYTRAEAAEYVSNGRSEKPSPGCSATLFP